jgi:phage N-6-adenine-methyltransferase
MTTTRTTPAKRNRDRQKSLASARGSVASVHFQSKSHEWATPQEFFDRLNALHNFTLDPCSTHENAKCAKHYTAAEDGLAHSWQGERVWMNPPYGRAIGAWMKKAYEESLGSALVVCLVPARTDTAWWHDYAAKGEIVFVRGRLKFGAGKNSAPFPSAVITLKPQNISSTK